MQDDHKKTPRLSSFGFVALFNNLPPGSAKISKGPPSQNTLGFEAKLHLNRPFMN